MFCVLILCGANARVVCIIVFCVRVLVRVHVRVHVCLRVRVCVRACVSAACLDVTIALAYLC